MGTSENTAIAQVSMQDMLERINDISSLDEILSLIKKIDALKVALDAVNTFHVQSIKYAKLEADALIRAVDLGGLNKLRGFHKKTAEWLSDLSEEERMKYILMCEDGLTIDQVYKREVGDILSIKKNIEKMESWRDDLIEECTENGIVDMTLFSKNVRDTFKFEHKSIGEDIIDGARKRLRRSGAVGVGDDSCVYVMPHSGNDEELRKAILLRYESICKDFGRIKEIAKASGVKMSYAEFGSGANWSFKNKPYIIHVLLALTRFGLISDEEDLYDAIEKNDMRLELDQVTRNLKISREKFIRIEYGKLPKQEEP